MKIEYTQNLVDELKKLGIDFFEETRKSLEGYVYDDTVEIEFVLVESTNETG